MTTSDKRELTDTERTTLSKILRVQFILRNNNFVFESATSEPKINLFFFCLYTRGVVQAQQGVVLVMSNAD